MQVWLALEEKNIPYDTVLINLQDKPEWFKQLVPTQLVPAVKINDKLVYESYDILMVWFLPQQHSQHMQKAITSPHCYPSLQRSYLLAAEMHASHVSIMQVAFACRAKACLLHWTY